MIFFAELFPCKYRKLKFASYYAIYKTNCKIIHTTETRIVQLFCARKCEIMYHVWIIVFFCSLHLQVSVYTGKAGDYFHDS
jgi:hypothetical protein